MKRDLIPWGLLLAGLLPLTGWTQPDVSVTATVLHDHFAGQLSPPVKAWTDLESAQFARSGQYNASALALDMQSRFAGQPVGTPEEEALTLVILVQAARAAEYTMTNSGAQLTALENARMAADRARIIHAKTLTLATTTNRSLTLPGTVPPGATNQPALNLAMEPRLYHDFILSQAAFNRLAEALKHYQSEATELVNAHLTGLK